MITVEKVLFLQKVSIFAGLDSQTLRQAAEITEEVVYPAGTPVFADGDPGDAVYMIHDGSVRIHKGDVVFRELEAPAYFGEMSLLNDEPRSASVTAVSDCLMLRIDQEAFRELLILYPQAALDIIRILSQYLLQAEAEARELKQKAEAAAAPEETDQQDVSSEG